jgi:hypothetical protein
MDSDIASKYPVLNERHALAEKLRNDGKPFAEIALALGVTAERARQIVTLVKKRRAEEAPTQLNWPMPRPLRRRTLWLPEAL